MRDEPVPATADLDLATVLHALSDPARLGIVRRLAACAEANCGELGPPGVTKSTTSHHLRVLREAGVTATRAEGTFKFVRLRCADLDLRFPGLLGAVLAALPEAGERRPAGRAPAPSATTG